MRRNKSSNISLCWVVCPLGSKVLRFIGKQTVRAKAVEQARSAWGEIKNCGAGSSAVKERRKFCPRTDTHRAAKLCME